MQGVRLLASTSIKTPSRSGVRRTSRVKIPFKSFAAPGALFVLRLGFLLFILAASTPNCTADQLPEGVRDTQNPSDVSLTPEESLARIKVPEGFQVTLFAAEPDIRRPIAFDIDDRGRLWVVENYSHPNWTADEGKDRIVILEDTDHDGRFDKRKIFYDRGSYFSAIAIGHGGVWIGNAPQLLFIPDKDLDDVPDGPPVVKLDGFEYASHNNVINNFHWGPDGWLYGAQGQPKKSFIGVPGASKEKRTMLTRGIWRYHPYDHRFEILARGMVNPWGADFNEFGDLFTTNTVIAHLWHIVPGMYCQRRGHERDNRFVYGRIQSMADHLHWSGGNWTDSRVTNDHHDGAGGGHAHCGAMIYLGDNWPAKYHGQLFTGNLHGNRINNDRLIPNASSYVGVHSPDFLFANDAWFRSMTQKYGPDGGVYISDWHDYGECHDKDGSHRSSGRIYKVAYGALPRVSYDLSGMTAGELAELHVAKNEWLVRHARRILHERFEQGHGVKSAANILKSQLNDTSDVVLRLRAIWTLALIGELDPRALITLSHDREAHVRRWAVKLLTDRGDWDPASIEAIVEAAKDSVPTVRLAAACAMQMMKFEDRWEVANRLVQHETDQHDPYLPLITWYGVEGALKSGVAKAIELAMSSRVPLVTQFVARKLTETRLRSLDDLIAMALVAPGLEDAQRQHAFLTGIAEAVENRKQSKPPKSWARLDERLSQSGNEALAALRTRLAIAFGDTQAIAKLKGDVLDENAPLEIRQTAFDTLRQRSDLSVALLHQLIIDAALRTEALRELALKGDADTGALLIDKLGGFAEDDQRVAISTLATRQDSTKRLLKRIREGAINRKLVSAYDLQNMRLHRDVDLQRMLTELWPLDADTGKKADAMRRYKKLLTKAYLSTGKASRGRKLFEETCAKCHRLFDEGSTLAPDLTGSGRANLDYVLSNLVDPSGLVDASYRMSTAITEEGRVVTGFIIEQTEKSVVMKTQQGSIEVPLGEVEVLETSDKSMMPEGLLDEYSNEEIRDLVLYLASPEQVPLNQ